MHEALVFAFNPTGPKEIIVYIVVIVAIVAVALYTRRSAPGR
jgi:hypothetical protein